MASIERLAQQFLVDVPILHQIVHGGVETVVQTEGGPVRSAAKLINDLDLEINQAADGVLAGALAAEESAAASAAEALATVSGAAQKTALAAGTLPLGLTQTGAGAELWDVAGKNSERVSVLDYMTAAERTNCRTGAGTLDVSVAFKRAIAAVTRSDLNKNPRIYIPAGTYLVEPKILSYSSLGTRRTGILFEGDGQISSTIKLKSDGVNQSWFYDNASVNISDRNQFYNLRFLGEDRNFCNAFKFTDSAGFEKLFQFIGCMFENLGDVMFTNGTTNTDMHLFLACEWRNIKTLVRLNNAQSVAHQFHGCNGTFTDSLIRIESGGGGDITYNGGSIINIPVTGVDSFLITASSPATSIGAGSFNFNSIRLESRGANAKLVNWPATDATNGGRNVRITFSASNLSQAIMGTAATRLNAALIGAGKSLSFIDCLLPRKATGTLDDFEFVVDSLSTLSGNSANPGTISFERCTASPDLRDKCRLVGSYGLIQCQEASSNETATDATRRALDFSFGWVNGGGFANTGALRRASIKRSFWPYWNGTAFTSESTIELPAGALVSRVMLYKPAQGTASALTVYYIGSDDKTVIYGQSTSARQDALHKIDVNVNVAAAIAGTKVRLWCDGTGTGVHSTGHAIVEYS
jgi:hypothetical protein